MRVPPLQRHRADSVGLELAGVVDEAGRGPERGAAGRDEPLDIQRLCQIARKGRRTCAELLDGCRRLLGGCARAVIVDGDVEAARGELKSDRPADAARRAGDERHGAEGRLRHRGRRFRRRESGDGHESLRLGRHRRLVIRRMSAQEAISTTRILAPVCRANGQLPQPRASKVSKKPAPCGGGLTISAVEWPI